MTTIYEALANVMADVQAVSKDGRNSNGNYNFRGIDAVVNAVGPALRKHKVIVVPSVDSYEFGEILTGKARTPMGHARVVVTYVFYAEDGSNVQCSTAAESFDSGDKATAKAMSVAFRTALLQALCLPTDEPDPDSYSYDRSPSPIDVILQHHKGDGPAAAAAAKGLGFDLSTDEGKTGYANHLTGVAA